MKILFLAMCLCILIGGFLIGYGLATMRAMHIIETELQNTDSDNISCALYQITRRL